MFTTRNWALLLLLISSALLAQTSDAPIEIEANQVQLLQAENKAIYTGNVVFVQGSTRISGAKIIVYSKANKLDTIEVFGAKKQLANYQQIIDGKKIVASSDTMHLNLQTKDIKLSGNASLFDGQNTIESERITYNNHSAKISAGKTQSGGRVKMILQPPTQD